MDNSEKEILENLKNFDTKILITKESYVEITVQGNCYQAYVVGIKQNEQFEIYINPTSHGETSINTLSFFGENFISKEAYDRKYFLNPNYDEFMDEARNIRIILNKKAILINRFFIC